ncbi:MAG: Cof-type HAD-IIB family hydrolase [Eubacteriales bacterium]|nr:Cof-type HAD-IIB family hydrolase [Eubacteriales bacterium]
MAVRLIALDIDGTLTNQSREVSERNRFAVKNAMDAGICVILATGRGRIATRPIWNLLNMHGYSIQYGGAMTVHIDSGDILSLHALDSEVIREVLNYSASIGVHAQIYRDDVVIFEKPNAFASKYIDRHSLPFQIDPDIRKKSFRDVPKILAFSEPEREFEVLAAYRERLRGIAQVSRSNPGYIEINCLGVTKATGLKELSALLNIDRSDIVAIGDNYLDQEMIEWAGTGICVADGAEEVKAIADLIIPPCDQDGVASWIEQYLKLLH